MLLFLNDISGSEILLILFFVLIFFGSKSIPGIARTAGRTIRQIKDASSELQSEIKKSSAGMKKDMNLDALNLDSLIRDTAEEVKRPLDQYASDLDNAVQFERPRNSQIPSSPIPNEPSGTVADQTTIEPTSEEKNNTAESID